MRRCPTEAIRIRGGKAMVIEDLCVDCGDCMAVCKSEAILPISGPSHRNQRPGIQVAVPSSVLYSQFDPGIHPYIIHLAFKELGFDEVVDTSPSCSALAMAYIKYMEQSSKRRPVIATDCPATTR